MYRKSYHGNFSWMTHIIDKLVGFYLVYFTKADNIMKIYFIVKIINHTHGEMISRRRSYNNLFNIIKVNVKEFMQIRLFCGS